MNFRYTNNKSLLQFGLSKENRVNKVHFLRELIINPVVYAQQRGLHDHSELYSQKVLHLSVV